MKRLISICMLFFGLVSILDAKVELPPIFADNMVLQQQTDAALWGKAKPDAKITITSTWSKTKTVVTADSDGKWFARIATPKAGGPYEITFNDGDKVTLKNVLIGEVWICSGQSNMEMQVKGFYGQPVNGSHEAIFGAKPSTLIRSCNVDRVISLDPKEECAAKWYEHTPEGVAEASATAYFFAKKLYEVLDIPIAVINASWGGTPIRSWINPEILKKEFASDINLDHYVTGELPKEYTSHAAGVLYNGMLHSLVPFTARGFIWYQGCTDRWKPELYKRLQPAFVKMLRDEWGDQTMPFYFTQIAPYEYENPDHPQAGFMMWAQAQTLELIPNSGMACLHDAGEYACIHPANKKVVGDRLAYQALENDYGVKGFDSKTPIPVKFEFGEGEAVVTFGSCALGLSPINMDIDGFELAGEDKVFHPAKARVTGPTSKQLKVTCPEVKNPVAVRYGMKNWSVAKVFNNFGIPVTPFRSDNWDK